MATKQFSSGEALKFGWNTFKKNVPFFIGIMLILVVISLIFSFIDRNLGSRFLIFIIFIIRFVVFTFLYLGIIKISLKFYDNKKHEIGDLFSCKTVLVSGVIASIICTLMVGVGLLILIVPGIILGIMFQFWGFYIVENNLSPFDSLKKSKDLTSGVKMDLFLFNLLILGINIAGGLLFLIGLIVTVPISFLAFAYVYRKLISAEEGSPGLSEDNTQEVPETA